MATKWLGRYWSAETPTMATCRYCCKIANRSYMSGVVMFIIAKNLHFLLLCQVKTVPGLIDYHAGDDQRGGGCWRRGVLHVNDVLGALDEKVVHQLTVGA